MDNQAPPSGCFYTLCLALLGVGIYLLVGVCGLIAGTAMVLQLTPTPDPRQEYDILGGFLMAAVVPGISFLCAGPLMVVGYIFYLEDLQMIELPTSLPVPFFLKAQDQFKNDTLIEK